MSHRIILTIAFLLTISILRSTPYFYIKVETPSVWTAECALLNAQKELREKLVTYARLLSDIAGVEDLTNLEN